MRKVQALVAVLPFGTSLLGALFVSALFFSTLLRDIVNLLNSFN